MTRKEKAKENFIEGYNCCQAVVLAFKDLVDIDENKLVRLSSGFGGGMGRLRETCGAITGVFMISSLLYGYDKANNDELKAKLYKTIQDLGLKFEEENGSLVCRELLGLKDKHSSSSPSKRTNDFYAARPCIRLIESATEILDDYIKQHKE